MNAQIKLSSTLLEEHATVYFLRYSSNLSTTPLSHIVKTPHEASVEAMYTHLTYGKLQKLLTTRLVTTFSLLSCKHTMSAFHPQTNLLFEGAYEPC